MTVEQDGHGEIGRLGPSAPGAFDHAKVEQGVRLILEGIGEDVFQFAEFVAAGEEW